MADGFIIRRGGSGGSAFAFLIVNYPSGATCTATNTSGSKDLSSTKKLFYVSKPSSGTEITCVAKIEQTGKTTKTQNVTFTAEGQSQEITMGFTVVVFEKGVTETNPMSGGTLDSTYGIKFRNSKIHSNSTYYKSYFSKLCFEITGDANIQSGKITFGYGTSESTFLESQSAAVAGAYEYVTVELTLQQDLENFYIIANSTLSVNFAFIGKIWLE